MRFDPPGVAVELPMPRGEAEKKFSGPVKRSGGLRLLDEMKTLRSYLAAGVAAFVFGAFVAVVMALPARAADKSPLKRVAESGPTPR